MRGLLISPKTWREFFKPLYADYCRAIHRAGKFAFFHSDGSIMAIIGDLIECGVDALNSQLFCMDLEGIAREYRFLLRQFMLTILREMSDAAKIDGCSYFGTYSRIILPLSKPALATVAIYTFMFNWNDFMAPLMYLSSTEKWTLTLGLSRFTGMYGTTAWNWLMACSLVTILPCIVIYFFAQGYFIQGIVITGVKG